MIRRYTARMNNDTPLQSINILPPLDAPETIRRRKWRMFKDGTATYGMTIGGISVIIAILLIFFYLLYVVFPLLLPASGHALTTVAVPASASGQTVYLDLEEKNEIGTRFTKQGQVVFFRVQDGQVLENKRLPFPADVTVTSYAVAEPDLGIVVYGFSNGTALMAQRAYQVSYPNDVRTVEAIVKYPLGEQPLVVDESGKALLQLAVQREKEATTLVAVTGDGRLVVSGYIEAESMLGSDGTLERTVGQVVLAQAEAITHLVLDKMQENLYLADNQGRVTQYDVRNKAKPILIQTVPVFENAKITAMQMLAGGISLLVGSSDGRISQWFPVRDAQNVSRLTRIRDFAEQQAAIVEISPEQRRKGFIAADASGHIGIYHSTAHRTLLVKQVSTDALIRVAISPRADRFIAEDKQGKIHTWAVENDHPEVSFSSLWGKVWYENYPEPDYTWQSSSASNDFEPKFSLTPLSFGTLKAAFYAMLLGVPLAVFGAIYTAYFMSPALRRFVKPGIEIMEALPTVILGFLAGLWMAPAFEKNLPGVFSLFILVPAGVLLFAWIWHKLPKKYTLWLPEGWAAALLIPVVSGLIWLSLGMSYTLEQVLFDGDMRHWLNSVGITFDQRNSLVVGFAMGFAVIPMVFSITEDAMFSVPKHLTTGSLALGATPWQTMTRVVILTASPGIFSAVMIGMGRAVGETMIVLMATGNTPIMNFNIFEGLRTLSANIAVEMPEAEVFSTHYRVLFLAALVLFLFTFFVNTMAEVVRHRLRKRYGSL